MNFKNYSRSILFSLALAPALGQAQTMVQNWLTRSNNAAITNSDDKPFYTHVDANGMIGIAGVSNNKVIVATYDANGNDLWTNKLEGYSSNGPLGIEKGPSGNYYVGYFWGGDIRKIGLNGGTAWTTTSSSYHGADFVVDSNGDVYVTGTDYPQTTIYIDKILANGTKIWTKTYTGFYGFGGRPVHLKMDHAGNLLMALNATNGSGDRFLSVAKFDTVGTNPTQVWHNIYSTTKGEVVDFMVDKTTNASYVTGAVDVGSFNQHDVITYKSGPGGVVSWTDIHNEMNSDDKGCGLEQDASGNVYVLYDSHTPMTKYSVRKYTSGGTFLTSNGTTYQYNYVSYLQPHIKIHPTTNQLYISGTRTSFNNDNMMVLYKTDLALTSISQIYQYDHDVTDNDYSTAIDVDPTTQDMILTGNIFKTVTGNDYYYAKLDTLGAFIYSNIYNGVINGSDYASSMVTDASNLPAVAGGTKSTLTQQDGFMVKYDATGNEQWQSVFPGVGGFNDYLNVVDINSSGHYYAGGYTETSSNNPDMWIIKVDGNGLKLWDLVLQGTNVGGKDEVKDVFTDNFNNGYAAGYQYNNGTGQDAVLVKFNSSGTLLWSKKLSGSGNQKDGYLDVGSKNGNTLYAAGYTTKPNGESDMLLAKYDANGNLQWSRTFNSPNNGNDTAIAVNVDSNQDVAIVGHGDSAIAMVAKYDSNGNLLWSSFPDSVTEVGPDVMTLPGGRTFITCFFDSSSAYSNRVFCYDNSGVELWHRDFVYGCCEHPMKLAKTSRSTILVALDYYGEIGAIELDTLGNELNNVRTNIWTNYGDNSYGGTRDIRIDGNGDVYVTGYFADETGSDIEMQKLCYGPAPIMISGSTSVCAQTQGNLYSVTSNTTITGYNWTSTSGLTVNTTAQPNSVSVDVAGTSGYVMLQQMNYCGTSAPDSIYVNVLALPVVNGGADQLICPGTSVSLNGSGATSYSWNNGVTNGVPFIPTTTMAYQVTGTDANNCSNKDTVSITLKAPPAVNLCMVTVDTFSTHNILVWEKAGLTNEIAYFNIYREDISNNYTLIAAVSYDSLSEYHDYDTLMADPNVTTKRYKIAAVDTCGNEGPKSGFHNTIFISHSGGTFTWNTYTIQNMPNPVNNYILWRDDFANGNWVQVGTTAGTQNVLNDPNYATFQATADWRVETAWNISCTSTARQSNGIQGAIIKSKSNISNNRTIGIKNNNDNMFAMYPNPTTGDLNISLNTGSGKTTIKVVSMLGQELYSATIEGVTSHTIDMSSFVSGSYMVQVTSNNSIAIKRIVKN